MVQSSLAMSSANLHLTTPRLHLAPMTDDDVAALVRHWGDEQVRRYLWDDQPVTLDTVSAVVTTSNQDFQRAGYGIWTAHLRNDGSNEAPLIGMCGLRELQETHWLEILYSLRPRYWGKGLATEAARRVLAYAFNSLAQERVVAGSDAGNVASKAVLQRLGLTPFRGISKKDTQFSYWSITREEFLAISEPASFGVDKQSDSQRGLIV